MRKMPLMVLASSALVGLGAAYLVTHARQERLSELPPNVFVSADSQSLVELPEEPKPLPAEPPPLPVLLQPEPMPALMDGREVTVSLRQPVEPEEVETIPAPTPEVIIASPEEAPPSPELIAMPTEGPAGEPMTLPSGHTHQHSPEYMPPSPSFPLSRELAEMEAESAKGVPPPVPVPVAPPVPTVPVRVAPVPHGPLPLPAMVFLGCRPSASTRYWDGFPLTGTFACSLENKEKLILPGSLIVRLQGSKVLWNLYIGLAPDQKCLWAYSTDGVERLVRLIMRNPDKGDEAASNLRLCLSRLQFVSPEDGAFALPADLVEAAGLDKEVVLIGVRDHFELWDAKSWREYSKDPNQRMTELLNDSSESGPLAEPTSNPTPERTHGGIQ